jgi:hypothetical protein
MKWKMAKTLLLAESLLLLLLAVAGMGACAFPGFGNSASWKEEVLLHDGRKIIAERSQVHKGRHEIGQPVPVGDHWITFTVPGSNESITWKDEYTKDIGRANFKLLALHILDETPYLISKPVGCLSYNKWGRPNPPYVIFKYDGKDWQRIPISGLPSEFKEVNLAIDTYDDEKKLLPMFLVYNS